MPGLARKLLICAAVDGLVVQPLSTKGQRPAQPVKIKYGAATVTSLSRDHLPDVSKPNSSFEAYGVIGFFTVSRLSYLVTITGREQVAHVRGFPVYVVTDVALTPCTNQLDAEGAVRQTAIQLRGASAQRSVLADGESDTETDASSTTGSAAGHEDPGALSDLDTTRSSLDDPSLVPEGSAVGERSSIAEDVIKRRGSYGRFAQRWFSSKGWVADRKRNPSLGNIAEKQQADASKPNQTRSDDPKALSNAVVAEKVQAPYIPSAGESLLPKLLRMAHIWFGTSRSFFFSYDVDITTKLGDTSPSSSPLHEQANPLYFWNRHLLKPFFAAKEDSLLLPLMQGFVGQRSFIADRNPPQVDGQQDSMEMSELASPLKEQETNPFDARSSSDLRASEKKFLITVVSRRSTKRAGLRYLRRGVDDSGCAANSVETEQILSPSQWNSSSRAYSFLQVRGSIPVFFTQSPYSLKPLPELQHSPDANSRAFQKHFDTMCKTYGSLQLINLVEKHGVEAIVGSEYEKLTKQYNEKRPAEAEKQPLRFEWFDFHAACRGMKFENVSLLTDKLGKDIEQMGFTEAANGDIVRQQGGVLRTNCMDCLDRTNVCQSSFGKLMLDLQLKEEGIDMTAQLDQDNVWFNTLWADNGDAISKQYASTAAMKGDYTRTRKRDYRGMVNDLGLSLTRFYNGMVNDHFSQAAIDFFLGNVTSLVFDEFEATMMTKDPGMSMSKMREQAIETSQKIVIGDEKEDFIGGWTVLSPHLPDTTKALPFEEVVLLLTDSALYMCRFDWKLDKVSSFERVHLSHVRGIKMGTYITSTISPAQADEEKNVGIVVTYDPGEYDIVRTNTRSLSSLAGTPASTPAPAEASGSLAQGILGVLSNKSSPAQRETQAAPRQIALKALSSHTSISDAKGVERMTEKEQINIIASEIERMVFVNQPVYRPQNHDGTSDKDTTTTDSSSGGPSQTQDTTRKQSGDHVTRSIIEKKDIISLEEAKRTTGLFEQLGHSIKKLVWAS